MTTNNKRTKKSAVANTGPTIDEHVTDLMLIEAADEAMAATTKAHVTADASLMMSAADDDSGAILADTKASFALGERKDRMLVATADDVTITSTSEPHKTVSFTLNRWAHFVRQLERIDDEAKELNRQIRSVSYREHIGDGYYVSVTGGYKCVDIRRFYVPYGLTEDQVRPSRSGIALRLDEWQHLMHVVALVNEMFPMLDKAKRCIDEADHMGQLGWLACRSCHPFSDLLML